MALGEYERAMKIFAEALVLARTQEDQMNLAVCLEGLAAVAAADGRAERAGGAGGAAEALREATGAAIQPEFHWLYERTLATAHDALGEEGFAAARAAGHPLPLECALDEALTLDAP